MAILQPEDTDSSSKNTNSKIRRLAKLSKADHHISTQYLVIPLQFHHQTCHASHRITYKLCVLMHSIHTGRSPRYLSDIVQSAASRTTRSGLRSAESNDHYTATYDKVRRTLVLTRWSRIVELSSFFLLTYVQFPTAVVLNQN